MLEVQNLRHKLCLARTAISRNCQVLAPIQLEFGDVQISPDNNTSTSVHYLARTSQTELESMLVRADNLLIRLDGASTLVSQLCMMTCCEH